MSRCIQNRSTAVRAVLSKSAPIEDQSRCRIEISIALNSGEALGRQSLFFQRNEKEKGGLGGIRTLDLLVQSQTLCHLSYEPGVGVGLEGFEPPPRGLRIRCSSQLSYKPIFLLASQKKK